MKHLKPYNEAKELVDFDKLHQACQDAFAELIDCRSVNISVENSEYFGLVKMGRKITIRVEKLFRKRTTGYSKLNFDEVLKSSSNFTNLLEDTNVALKRIKEEFPNIIITPIDSDVNLLFVIDGGHE